MSLQSWTQLFNSVTQTGIVTKPKRVRSKGYLTNGLVSLKNELRCSHASGLLSREAQRTNLTWLNWITYFQGRNILKTILFSSLSKNTNTHTHTPTCTHKNNGSHLSLRKLSHRDASSQGLSFSALISNLKVKIKGKHESEAILRDFEAYSNKK